uniref:Mitochondrial import inner membrane translocase subunit TIM50 n=1 Tax=Diabrotica virgifera virgifera TaxID=50390 RepID=A0A6P7H1I5_DIAVI
LENLVDLYEIVVFTAQPGMSIFPVIEAMDPKHLISYKLVRDSTHFVDGLHVKNLDKLNRDLSKVIVIDWNAESIKFHPDNHLNLDRWQGENDDTVLLDLTSFLKTIAHMEVEDVREVLKYYKQYDDPLTEFRKRQLQFYEDHKDNKQEHGGLSKTTPKFFSKLFNYLI